MFFVVSKILKIFILPLTWIIGLLVLTYFVKNKKWRKGLFVTSMVLLVVFTNKPLLQYAQYITTKKYIHQKTDKKYYRVAVIMGGYGNMDTSTMQMNYIDDRGARLWEPVRLYHAGIVEKIMISGDASIAIDAKGNSMAKGFLRYMQDGGVFENDIILEQHARNTRENAKFSIAILDSMGYKPNDCLLVTSATHMKRSLSCFATEGWQLDGYAVNIYPKPHPKLYEFLPQWKPLTDWKELLNEWVGNVVYKIVGY